MVKKSGMGREFSARDCVHVCLRLAADRSLRQLKDPEGREGKGLTDEFAAEADSRSGWRDAEVRIGYFRRLSWPDSDEPFLRKTTRQESDSKAFHSALLIQETERTRER